MDKANVMKALDMCINHPDTCVGCPYENMDDCNMMRNKDTLALLKADEKANENHIYHTAIIFTKRDNLLKWFDVNGYQYAQGGNMEYSDKYQKMRALYATEREIQLILLVRYEENKCICRIKCPINPLPVKGEFQCVSTSEMTNLLTYMGWKYKEKIHANLFR